MTYTRDRLSNALFALDRPLDSAVTSNPRFDHKDLITTESNFEHPFQETLAARLRTGDPAHDQPHPLRP